MKNPYRTTVSRCTQRKHLRFSQATPRIEGSRAEILDLVAIFRKPSTKKKGKGNAPH